MATAPTYRDKLVAAHDHAARVLATITTRALLENRVADTVADRRLLRIQVDAYARQLAWMDRRTGWVWPHTPAWCD